MASCSCTSSSLYLRSSSSPQYSFSRAAIVALSSTYRLSWSLVLDLFSISEMYSAILYSGVESATFLYIYVALKFYPIQFNDRGLFDMDPSLVFQGNMLFQCVLQNRNSHCKDGLNHRHNSYSQITHFLCLFFVQMV